MNRSTVVFAARRQLRGQVPAIVALTVLLALVGGVALAALVGARRTDTVIHRRSAVMRMPDATVNVAPSSGLDADQVEHLKGVTSAARVSYVLALEVTPAGDYGEPDITPLTALDSRYGRTSEIPQLVRGRRADPRATDEATINTALATAKHLGPGGTFTLAGWRAEDQDRLFAGEQVEPVGFRTSFRVTGVVRDFADLIENRGEKVAYPTPAFWTQIGSRSAHFGPGVAVHLARGPAGVADLRHAVANLGGEPDAVQTSVERQAVAQRSVHVQAVALYVFAALAALVGLAIVAQAIARQDVRTVGDIRGLRALGAAQGDLRMIVAGRPVIVAVVGSALAAVVAVVLSHFVPFGLAGRIEPDKGLHVDPGVLVPGAVAVAVMVVLIAMPSIRRAVRIANEGRSASVPHASRLARSATAVGGPAVGTGVRMALDPGQGRAAVPVRSVAFGAIVGVATAVAAATFVTSFERLRTTPALYGWNFDVVIGSSDSGDQLDAVAPILESSSAAAGYSVVATSRVVVNRHDLPVFGIESKRGRALPSVVRGRLAAGADDIAVGELDLRDIGAKVGDRILVRADAHGAAHRVRIVGTVALPNDTSTPGGEGHGGVLTLAGLRSIVPDAPVNVFYVELARGHSMVDLGEIASRGNGLTARRGANIDNLGRVRNVPLLLAALVALLTLASLTHALTAGLRRRSHDLAVLRALGFDANQLSTVLAAQASTFAVIAIAIGLPIGVVAGRLSWGFAAHGLGVAGDPRFPAGAIAIGAVAMVVVVNVIATVPAVAARRVRASDVLHAE